jgi:hypothetical protein
LGRGKTESRARSGQVPLANVSGIRIARQEQNKPDFLSKPDGRLRKNLVHASLLRTAFAILHPRLISLSYFNLIPS